MRNNSSDRLDNEICWWLEVHSGNEYGFLYAKTQRRAGRNRQVET